MISGLEQDTDKSTSDLKQRINIFLSQKGLRSLRRLNIEVTDGTVTFSGTVSSFYERQLCHTCKCVAGVRKLVDDLKVEVPSPSRPQGHESSMFVSG